MNGLDRAVLIGCFGVMVAIGVWSHQRVDDVSDFFTAGGRMPWWRTGTREGLRQDQGPRDRDASGSAPWGIPRQPPR